MPAKKESSKIQFFGEIDLNDQGGIKSDMPAWYLESQVESMEEEIHRKETSLANNRVTAEQVPMMREELKREKAKLEQIKQSKPNLSDAEKDRCYKAYQSLRKQIQDSMPTRKQAKDGLVNPRDELKRLKGKHIKISPELASSLGVKSDHGKISGDQANKCFQILGKALGEPTNPETLRRDGNSEAYQSIHDLTKMIMDGREVRD